MAISASAAHSLDILEEIAEEAPPPPPVRATPAPRPVFSPYAGASLAVAPKEQRPESGAGSAGASGRRRAASRRDRKVEKMLRQADSHPVEMTITMDFIVSGAAVAEDADPLAAAIQHVGLVAGPANPLPGAPDNHTAGPPPTRQDSRRTSNLSPLISQRESTMSGHGHPQLQPVPSSHSLLSASNSIANSHSQTPFRAQMQSNFIHYEFVAPHDDHVTRCDLVIHPSSGKLFLDSDIKAPPVETVEPQNLLHATTTHTYLMASNMDLIHCFHRDDFQIKLWDTKDRVSTRARFDRVKGNNKAPRATELQGLEELLARADKLHNKPRRSPLERRIRGDPAANAASDDGAGAVINVDLADLFIGNLTTTTYLEDVLDTGLQHLLALKITLTLDKPLLSGEQRAFLNPMVVTLKQVYNLPRTPLSYEKLEEQCQCTTAVFTAVGCSKAKRWPCRQPHGAVATWNRRFVVLTGHINREDFAHWLQYGPGLVIEIHDRDRKIAAAATTTNGTNNPTSTGATRAPKSAPKSSPSVRSASRTAAYFDDQERRLADMSADGSQLPHSATSRPFTSHPAEETERPWDPFGVAVADLSAICRGARILQVSVPVLPCSQREGLGVSADGAIGRPTHPGHYVAAGTMLDLVVEMSYARDFSQHISDEQLLIISGAMDPVAARKRVKKTQPPRDDGGFAVGSLRLKNSASSLQHERSSITMASPLPALPPSSAGGRQQTKVDHRPFTRLVVLCDPAHEAWVGQLRHLVIQANIQVLNLESAAETDTLQNYELSAEDAAAENLDCITGVAVALPDRIFVILEGLREGCLLRIMNSLGWPAGADLTTFRTLFNSTVHVGERMYASFGIDLPHIQLAEPLVKVLCKQELYFKGHSLHGCLAALSCLQQLSHAERMAQALRQGYFPPADSLQQVREQLAVARRTVLKSTGSAAEAIAAAAAAAAATSFAAPDSQIMPSLPLPTIHTSISQSSTNTAYDGAAAWRASQAQTETSAPSLTEDEAGNSSANESEDTAVEPAYRTSIAAPIQRRSTPPRLRTSSKVPPGSVAGGATSALNSATAAGGATAGAASETSMKKHRLIRLSDFEDTNGGRSVFNYSSQALNASEAVLKHLRARAKKELGERAQLTTAPRYLSGAFSLVDEAEESRLKAARDRARWQTPAGFNLSTKTLGAGEELSSTATFRALGERLEQGVFAKSLASQTATFSNVGRDVSWHERGFSAGPVRSRSFGPETGFAVHHENEDDVKNLARAQQRQWREKLVVDDERFHVHRTPYEGADAVPLLDRHRGLLKDEPQRETLKAAQRLLPEGPSLQATQQYQSATGPLTLDDRGRARRV